MTHNKNPTPFHYHHHHGNPQLHHHEPTKKNPSQNQIKPIANSESKRWPKKKKSSQNLHKPNYKLISPLQTTLETHEHATANHHTTPPHTHEPRKHTQKYPEIATIPRRSNFPSLTSTPDPQPTPE